MPNPKRIPSLIQKPRRSFRQLKAPRDRSPLRVPHAGITNTPNTPYSNKLEYSNTPAMSEGYAVISGLGRPAALGLTFRTGLGGSSINCWAPGPDSRLRYLRVMRIATGKVVAGKLELEGEPLEEGATVTVLVPEADETFELTPEEQRALRASLEEANRGEFVDAEALLRELRQ